METVNIQPSIELLAPSSNFPVPPPITPAFMRKNEHLVIVEEYSAVSQEDVEAIKALFGEAFPLRYGDYFYDGLKNGTYGGRPLLTCIVRSNGVLVGAACASREGESSEEDSTRMVAKGTKTYLMTLAVVPAERRRGVASALVDRVMKWAETDTSCTVLYLHVIDYNVNAQGFYKRLGFQKHSRVADFYPIEGNNHDAFVYLKYMNGGEPPLPEPPSVLESFWDWFSGAVERLAVLAFGERKLSYNESELSDVEEEKKLDHLV